MSMDYRDAALATDPRIWDTLDNQERTSVLQALENHNADWSGRSPRTVTPQYIPSDQGSHNFGYYNHYNHPDKLFLNEEDLGNIDETLDTLYHEGEHAYQHDCVDGKINIPEPIRQQFDDAFNNYVPPEQDPRAYYDNFAEKDARDEAQRAIMRLENDRAIFQQNAHDIETSAEMDADTQAPESIGERGENEPEQSDDQSNFWSTVPGSNASSDGPSNDQENEESNTVSM